LWQRKHFIWIALFERKSFTASMTMIPNNGFPHSPTSTLSIEAGQQPARLTQWREKANNVPESDHRKRFKGCVRWSAV
jgi:hypothetical protein